MNQNMKDRLKRLEERQSKSDQKKEYCPCTCHWTYLEISEEQAGRVIDILKSMEVQLPDGTMIDGYESLKSRIPEKKECNCTH